MRHLSILGSPCWLHADLHPADGLVLDAVLAGVIGFGEMCAGHPATDVSAAWLLLLAEGVITFSNAHATPTKPPSLGLAVGRCCAFDLIAIGQNGRLGFQWQTDLRTRRLSSA